MAVALPDHLWLDRVVRGRAWIPLLGVLLAGIVFAQVEILKLGANMGRALEQTTALTTQNEALRGSVAQLSDDQRIERLAANMGLVLPPPGAVGYLAAKPNGDVAGALANLHAPAPSAFALMTTKNGAMVTGPGTSTLPPSPGAPPPPASTATTAATTGASASTSSTSLTTSSAVSGPSATSTSQAGATVTSSQAGATVTSSQTGATATPTQTGATATAAPTASQSSPATTSQTAPQAPAAGTTTQSAGPATGAAAVGASQQASGG